MQCINRPLQHIIPLKIKDTHKSNKIIDRDNSGPANRSDTPRPTCAATGNGNVLRPLCKL